MEFLTYSIVRRKSLLLLYKRQYDRLLRTNRAFTRFRAMRRDGFISNLQGECSWTEHP